MALLQSTVTWGAAGCGTVPVLTVPLPRPKQRWQGPVVQGELTLVAVTGGSSHLTPELVEKRAFWQRVMAVGEKRGEGLERGGLAGAKRAGSLRGVIVTVAANNW